MTNRIYRWAGSAASRSGFMFLTSLKPIVKALALLELDSIFLYRLRGKASVDTADRQRGQLTGYNRGSCQRLRGAYARRVDARRKGLARDGENYGIL